MPKRTDDNQQEIIDALRKIGATVHSLHAVGQGCPDLLVGYQRENYLLEVKRPNTGKLTVAQQVWHREWNGSVHVVTSVDEAVRVLGFILVPAMVNGVETKRPIHVGNYR